MKAVQYSEYGEPDVLQLDVVLFNYRVREELVVNLRRKRARLVGGFRGELELEVLALPHVADGAVAHRVQGIGDGLSLRIEDRGLQRHEYFGLHALGLTSRPLRPRSRALRSC